MRTEARRNDGLAPVAVGRYAVFAAVALAALAGDLASKEIVFRDLGFPGAREPGAPPDRPGTHEVFTPAVAGGRIVEGQSAFFLDGWLRFCLFTSFNRGALWGVGQGWTWLFASLSVLAIAGVIYWLFFRRAAHSLWLTIALALIAGGTLGNLYDRLGLHGYSDAQTGEVHRAVRDFLLFIFGDWPWPVFNFADSFLVTGAIMLVLQSLSTGERSSAGAGAGEANRAAEPAPVPAGARDTTAEDAA
jgi:signal peptidase II